MQFLSDISLPCPVCRGRRWQDWILAVRPELDDGVRRSIDEVLDLTVEEAAAAFANHPAIMKSLSLLSLTGLGYLKLGQPLSTLSGGERQRLKLAARIAFVCPVTCKFCQKILVTVQMQHGTDRFLFLMNRRRDSILPIRRS